MELHEEIRRARKDLDLSQARLAELCRIQRRQLSILENGGNVTLNTLRKVISFLPNLKEFTFEQIRMKPQYIDIPPFDWGNFNFVMLNFMKSMDELTKAVNRYLQAGNAEVQTDPEGVTEKTERLARELVEIMAKALKEGPIWKDPADEDNERHQRKARRRPRKKA